MPAHIYARLYVCMRMRAYVRNGHTVIFLLVALFWRSRRGGRVCLSVFVLCLLANWKIDIKRNAKSQQQQQQRGH